MSTNAPQAPRYTKKDFESDQDVRWCPGCGDYAILSTIQKMMPDLGVPREDIVFVSGIGCSSRFPYYMNTYGFHTIHGRAPAIATGLRLARPDLKVFVVTGDGDGLSIGGNHMLHILRRNVNVTILLFNNRIYGLTKGQYSPTSELGKVTKSTPLGSTDRPINPCAFALGVGATFVARTVDRNIAHMEETLKRAAAHRGTAFVEILQNCNIYNDMAWGILYDRESKAEHEPGSSMGSRFFGPHARKGLVLTGAASSPPVTCRSSDSGCTTRPTPPRPWSWRAWSAPSFRSRSASWRRSRRPSTRTSLPTRRSGPYPSAVRATSRASSRPATPGRSAEAPHPADAGPPASGLGRGRPYPPEAAVVDVPPGDPWTAAAGTPSYRDRGP
jgi:2-oxoglutarate ferredoxin oxidoreductase subunit beta